MFYTWHILSPEYPPDLGGVGDYSWQVANQLQVFGHTVHVWTAGEQGDRNEDGVIVHRMPGGMRPTNLRVMESRMRHLPGRQKLLLQWVPHGFGYRSMNIFLCRWLHSLSSKQFEIELMIHEPFLQFWEGSWRQNIVASVHRVMIMMLLRSARRVWVSTPDWGKQLRPWAGKQRKAFYWLPVPSNIPAIQNTGMSALIRKQIPSHFSQVVGHFGTFGLAKELMKPFLLQILRRRPGVSIVLMGPGSKEFVLELQSEAVVATTRVMATGPLEPTMLSAYFRACDIFVQPYLDGVNGRRGSVMAALAHGKPVVTTHGRATEAIWREREAVLLVPCGDGDALCQATCKLLDDPDQQARLSSNAQELYNDLFDVRHTVGALVGSMDSPACAS